MNAPSPRLDSQALVERLAHARVLGSAEPWIECRGVRPPPGTDQHRAFAGEPVSLDDFLAGLARPFPRAGFARPTAGQGGRTHRTLHTDRSGKCVAGSHTRALPS